MNVQTAKDDNQLTVTITGAIDTVTAPQTEDALKTDIAAAKALEGMQIVKELYVKGRLVNIVVKPQ